MQLSNFFRWISSSLLFLSCFRKWIFQAFLDVVSFQHVYLWKVLYPHIWQHSYISNLTLHKCTKCHFFYIDFYISAYDNHSHDQHKKWYHLTNNNIHQEQDHFGYSCIYSININPNSNSKGKWIIRIFKAIHFLHVLLEVSLFLYEVVIVIKKSYCINYMFNTHVITIFIFLG